MKFVLEGPDNAGKTTLLQNVLKRASTIYTFHPGGPPVDVEDEIKCLNKQVEMFYQPGHAIIDRVTCISQQVYAPDPEMDVSRRSRCKAMLLAPDLCVIYCRPPNETLMDTANFTWRDGETEEHRQKIITRQHEFVGQYDDVMLNVPCVYYDWKDSVHRDMITNLMVQALNGSAEAASWFKSVLNYRRV